MRQVWKWAKIGVPILILILIASAAIHFQRRGRVIKEADAAAHRFLVALEDHQYVTAYAMLDAAEKRKVSLASMRQGLQSLEKPHRLDGVAPSCDEYHPDDSLAGVTLSYSVGFGENWMPVRIKMAQTSDGWRVGYYGFNESPA